jgi:hypothetical protein
MEWTIQHEWLRSKNYSENYSKMSRRRQHLGETDVDERRISN